MWRSANRLWRNSEGAVAPTVALSLTALIVAGGIAFDYAHMASLDTELQQAADQAALAAATQLDGLANARARATAAANQIVLNKTHFANDGNGSGQSLAVATVTFCSSYDDSNAAAGTPSAPAGCTVATGDADARVVVVTMGARRANFALTPILAAASSGDLTAQAAASVQSSICKVPPVMICNPDEPTTNTNELLDFNPAKGAGITLVTGSATAPGNFGWLESGLGNGTPALAGELGYNVPMGPCQAITGVTTKTGMDTSVLNAFNTRFDVYANGNTTCPNQGGGTCSPSVNTRKDLTCPLQNAGDTSCKSNSNWSPVIYNPPFSGGKAQPLDPTNYPTGYPAIMGYPHDLCHSGLKSQYTCGLVGTGVWDVNAYFKVNYGWSESAWRTALGMTGTTDIPTRYKVYKWEIANPTGTGTQGIAIPQTAGLPAKTAAFGVPASGNGAGVGESATQPDRRTIAVAVLNCYALNAHGKTTNVPVPSWLKVFLTEPAVQRGSGGSVYTDQKDIYVEFIEKSQAQDDQFSEVVRRDVPYLVK